MIIQGYLFEAAYTSDKGLYVLNIAAQSMQEALQIFEDWRAGQDPSYTLTGLHRGGPVTYRLPNQEKAQGQN